MPALAHLILFAALLGPPGTSTLLGALRLLIELTNANPAWSGALADCATAVPSLIRLVVASRQGEDGFNTLCLALGVLTNLVETVPGVKHVLRDTRTSFSLGSPHRPALIPSRPTDLNPICQSRKCARSCRCDSTSQSTAIALLARLFLDPLLDRPDEVRPFLPVDPCKADDWTTRRKEAS